MVFITVEDTKSLLLCESSHLQSFTLTKKKKKTLHFTITITSDNSIYPPGSFGATTALQCRRAAILLCKMWSGHHHFLLDNEKMLISSSMQSAPANPHHSVLWGSQWWPVTSRLELSADLNIYSPRTNSQISPPFRRMPGLLPGSCADWRKQNILGLPLKTTWQTKENTPPMCDMRHLRLWNEIPLRLITHPKHALACSQTQAEWRLTWCGCGKCSQFPKHLVKTELFSSDRAVEASSDTYGISSRWHLGPQREAARHARITACDLPLSISTTGFHKLLSNKNFYDLGICCLL